MFGALKRGFWSTASLILVRNVVGVLQPKRILAASRGFLAAARLSCTAYAHFTCFTLLCIFGLRWILLPDSWKVIQLSWPSCVSEFDSCLLQLAKQYWHYIVIALKITLYVLDQGGNVRPTAFRLQINAAFNRKLNVIPVIQRSNLFCYLR